MTKTLSFAAALTLILGAVSTAQAETLVLNVNTATAKGTVRAAVYADAAAFDQGKVLTGVSGPAMAGMTTLTIKDLDAGTYGIALFHDVNGNEELDTNLFGAPNEPYGFSNNPVIKFSAPKFDTFAIEYGGDPMTLNVTLNGG